MNVCLWKVMVEMGVSDNGDNGDNGVRKKNGRGRQVGVGFRSVCHGRGRGGRVAGTTMRFIAKVVSL